MVPCFGHQRKARLNIYSNNKYVRRLTQINSSKSERQSECVHASRHYVTVRESLSDKQFVSLTVEKGAIFLGHLPHYLDQLSEAFHPKLFIVLKT